MFRLPRSAFAAAAALAATLLSLSGGCTSPKQYVQNGFKVGPDYRRPEAPVAERWIDAGDPNRRVREVSEDLSRWWTVFNDPVLNRLMTLAYQQNLTLREAGFRVLEARAQLGIARGTFFPQLQNAVGGYRRWGPARASSTSGTPASTSLGSLTCGAGCAGRSPQRTTSWMPRSRTTTSCWLRFWATWPRTTCRFAPTRNGSRCCAKTPSSRSASATTWPAGSRSVRPPASRSAPSI